MTVKVFDTHVRTKAGRYLHFDVLIEGNDIEKAKGHARDYLLGKGLADEDISQNQCRFCHVEPGNPLVAQAIKEKGYYILELQGCQE